MLIRLAEWTTWVPNCIWDQIWLGPPRKTNTSNLSYCSVISHHVPVACSDEFLRRFWEVEEKPQTHPNLSPEEWMVIKHFEENHRRSGTGTFMVPLLQKRPLVSLGLKPSANSSHLNVPSDQGTSSRNSLMWLKRVPWDATHWACSFHWPTKACRSSLLSPYAHRAQGTQYHH